MLIFSYTLFDNNPNNKIQLKIDPELKKFFKNEFKSEVKFK